MAILRLTQDLAWIEEVLNAGKGIKGLNDIELRKSGTPLTTMDKFFHTKMNEYIVGKPELDIFSFDYLNTHF